RRLGFCGHIRKLVLNSLEAYDRLIELDPLSRIFDRNIERPLGKAHCKRRYAWPRFIEVLHRNDKTHSFPADQPVFGNAAIFEYELTRGGCADAELFFLFPEGKSRVSLFDHEKTCASRTLGAVGYGEYRINFRLAAVGDPLLGPVDD